MQDESEAWRRQLATWAPLVLLLSAGGSVVFLVFRHSTDGVELGLFNFSRLIGALFLVYGYLYAETAWTLPKLHWLGVVALGMQIALRFVIVSIDPLDMETFGTLLDLLWRFWLFLVCLVGGGALIGWGKYFIDRRTEAAH